VGVCVRYRRGWVDRTSVLKSASMWARRFGWMRCRLTGDSSLIRQFGSRGRAAQLTTQAVMQWRTSAYQWAAGPPVGAAASSARNSGRHRAKRIFNRRSAVPVWSASYKARTCAACISGAPFWVFWYPAPPSTHPPAVARYFSVCEPREWPDPAAMLPRSSPRSPASAIRKDRKQCKLIVMSAPMSSRLCFR